MDTISFKGHAENVEVKLLQEEWKPEEDAFVAHVHRQSGSERRQYLEVHLG
jgi:hypothetical protein